MDEAASGAMATIDDGTPPATDEEDSAAAAPGVSDGEAVAPTDEQAAAEDENAQADQPLVETRVVPDDPVEVTDDPPAVTRIEEEPTAAEEPAVTPPSFDTVRITPDGRAVIAGRAPPSAEVAVRSESVDLGSETANRQGEWTLVPFIPIPPGDHVFSAIATLPDGTQIESDQVLIVSVPDPDAEDEAVVAFLVPREGEGGRILQKPAPEEEEVEPEPADEEIELARLPDPTADEPGADAAADEEAGPAAAEEEAGPSVAEEEPAPAARRGGARPGCRRGGASLTGCCGGGGRPGRCQRRDGPDDRRGDPAC